jgi:hypothetical protein
MPGSAMAELPTGTVTFLFTDLEGAIAFNLQALAHALAATDPDQARTVLAAALQSHTTLGYESPGGLMTAVHAAARLQEWRAMLSAASRVLHHQTRTGALGIVYVAATLNLVARGVAESQPETAAVLQGTVKNMLRRLAPDVAAPVGASADQNDGAVFVTAMRRDTTQLLTTVLGDARLRELRTQGAAMDETQACNARSHRRLPRPHCLSRHLTTVTGRAGHDAGPTIRVLSADGHGLFSTPSRVNAATSIEIVGMVNAATEPQGRPARGTATDWISTTPSDAPPPV